MLKAEDVRKAIMAWPGLYETKKGFKFKGLPVSEVPACLRDAGWKNVSRLDASDLKKLGLKIVTARYIGGVRPKKFCLVVVAALRWNFRNGPKN